VMVTNVFKENVQKVQNLILKTIPKVKEYDNCPCTKDIKTAVL
jgi:hypothetical protein